MTSIPSSPLPPVPAVAAVPATDPAASEKAAQTASPQPQAAVVPESDPVLNALQKLVAAETALAQSVNAALPTAAASQGGLAPLLADLVQAQQTPDLPAPVQAAIVEILALRSPLDAEITGADIKAALTNSGLFSEAKAAAELQATNAGAQAAPAGTDIKTALLVLRQALKTWLSDATAQPTGRPLAGERCTARAIAISRQQSPAANLSRRCPAAMRRPRHPSPCPELCLRRQVRKARRRPHRADRYRRKRKSYPRPKRSRRRRRTPGGRRRRPSCRGPRRHPRPAGPPAAADNIKTAPPVPQQVVKASPAGARVQPDAPAAAKSAAPEPLRAPLNNSPPPISRGTAIAPPSLAPAVCHAGAGVPAPRRSFGDESARRPQRRADRNSAAAGANRSRARSDA